MTNKIGRPDPLGLGRAAVVVDFGDGPIPLNVPTGEPTADDRAGMKWWNRISKGERALWLENAGIKAHTANVSPADAWNAYKTTMEDLRKEGVI